MGLFTRSHGIPPATPSIQCLETHDCFLWPVPHNFHVFYQGWNKGVVYRWAIDEYIIWKLLSLYQKSSQVFSGNWPFHNNSVTGMWLINVSVGVELNQCILDATCPCQCTATCERWNALYDESNFTWFILKDPIVHMCYGRKGFLTQYISI